MGDIPSSRDLQPGGDNTIRKLFASITAPDKIKVSIELQDEHGHPNVSISLFDASDQFITRAFIIDCVDQSVDFTLHMRSQNVYFPLKLVCSTFLEDDNIIDQEELTINE